MKIDKICILLFVNKLENALSFSAGRTRSIAKVLTDVYEKFWSFYFRNPNNEKFIDYSSQITKICIYLLWDSFELENAPIFLAERAESIANVLTDVHNKFLPFLY